MKHAVFPNIGSIAHGDILRCDPDMSVRDAAILMENNKVSSVVLEGRGERHIFTVEDLLGFIHAGGDYYAPLSALSIKHL